MQRWDKYFFHIPELIPDDINPLVDYYDEHKGKIKANGFAGLNFLVIDDLPTCLNNIANKVNKEYFQRLYYYSNSEDVARHSDKRRDTVITIPLINHKNIPTMFDSGPLYYKGPTLVNTLINHWVENPNKEFRLFIQIELKTEYTFEEYVDLYNKGELIK